METLIKKVSLVTKPLSAIHQELDAIPIDWETTQDERISVDDRLMLSYRFVSNHIFGDFPEDYKSIISKILTVIDNNLMEAGIRWYFEVEYRFINNDTDSIELTVSCSDGWDQIEYQLTKFFNYE